MKERSRQGCGEKVKNSHDFLAKDSIFFFFNQREHTVQVSSGHHF